MIVLNNVTFRHAAHPVQDSDFEEVLTVERAGWFHELLNTVPELQIRGEPCQEDWGVVFAGSRAGKSFWIGLSPYSPDEQSGSLWLAHFHHGSFAWFQSFTASGKRSMQQLLQSVHAVFTAEPLISHVTWYAEKEMNKADPKGFPNPG